jgi:hypothetical protein
VEFSAPRAGRWGAGSSSGDHEDHIEATRIASGCKWTPRIAVWAPRAKLAARQADGFALLAWRYTLSGGGARGRL